MWDGARELSRKSAATMHSHHSTVLASVLALVASLLTPVVIVVAIVVGTADPATAGTYSGRLRAAARFLDVAKEHRAGYDRSKFTLWIDADGDGCDTRDEVLIAEAVLAPTLGPSCSLTLGKWFSYYDGVTTLDPSTFDIDHMVPLAEAWDSGARRWNADTRKRYANDVGDPRSLVAVSASSNRSKGDQDPAQWMPPRKRAGCRYIRDWITVKIRWHLTADRAEKRFLVHKADHCRDARMTVTRARVVLKSSSGSSTTDSGLMMTKIQYDPNGPDTPDGTDYNGEYVVIENVTSTNISIGGWKLKDAAGATFRFPTQGLGAGSTVKVHSGHGTNSASDVYAGWGWIWNNSGDSARLIAPNGTVADRCSYSGGGAVATC